MQNAKPPTEAMWVRVKQPPLNPQSAVTCVPPTSPSIHQSWRPLMTGSILGKVNSCLRDPSVSERSTAPHTGRGATQSLKDRLSSALSRGIVQMAARGSAGDTADRVMCFLMSRRCRVLVITLITAAASSSASLHGLFGV